MSVWMVSASSPSRTKKTLNAGARAATKALGRVGPNASLPRKWLRITVDLADGRTIGVPLAWSWRLSEATTVQRGNLIILGSGQGIHWPEIDEDISVEGMFSGVLARRRRRINVLASLLAGC